MGIFRGFFKKKFKKTEDVSVTKKVALEKNCLEEKWEEIPGFIPAKTEEYQLVSIVATAIAAGDCPTSQFVVKKILKRNPEAKKVALIAACLASEDSLNSKLQIKKILKKVN